MEHNKQKYDEFMKEFDPKLIMWKGTNGKYIEIKLSKIVHLLFWGQSGSWKSVFVLQLLFQILYKTNPSSLKLLLIDPLRVSFKDFKELPHLTAPVWNTVSEAIQLTNTMMDINKERYVFLENVWYENIYEYNEWLQENKIPFKVKGLNKIVWLEDIPDDYIEKTRTENYVIWEPIPQLVIFYDEFNALMLNSEFGWKNPAEASSPVLKDLIWVSEQARKAWIIIILWTQKINASTVPTAIRWNLKTRICLKVSSTMASRTILGDTAENNTQWAKLVWYWDLLAFNEDLNSSLAIRGQSFYVSMTDMMDLINWFLVAYWKNEHEYIKVNVEYAQKEEDLEPLPIDYEDFKIWLPNLLIVKDNLFLKPKYTKLLSEIARRPFEWDDKILALRYSSLKKDLKIIKQQLMDTKILAINKLDNNNEKKSKTKEEKDGYLGFNLKLKGFSYIMDKHNLKIEETEEWDTDDYDYQVDMIKLMLLHLNRSYNQAARKLSIDLRKYEK